MYNLFTTHHVYIHMRNIFIKLLLELLISIFDKKILNIKGLFEIFLNCFQFLKKKKRKISLVSVYLC